MASYGKGKSIEYNGPWSQWFWDDGGNGQGFWYRSRLKANGEQELDFNNDPNNPSYGPLGKSVPRNADNLDITTSSSSLEAQNGLSSSEHDSAYTTRPPYVFDSQMSRTDYTYPPATSKTATSELQSHSQDRRAQTSRYAPNPSYSPQGNTSMRSPTSGQEQAYDPVGDVTRSLDRTSLNHFPAASFPKGEASSSYSNQASISKSQAALDARYKAVEVRNYSKFWKIGRVFKTLWVEPAGDGTAPHGEGSQYTSTYLGGKAFSEIRRFVVLRTNHGNVQCSPIHSYNNQGTLKPGLPDVKQHAIIYTSDKPPSELSYFDEAQNREIYENLTKDPIRVVPDQRNKDCDLGVASRLNYSKVFTVEYYAKITNIGMVHKDSIPTLMKGSMIKQPEEPPEPPRRHRSSDSKPSGHHHSGSKHNSGGRHSSSSKTSGGQNQQSRGSGGKKG